MASNGIFDVKKGNNATCQKSYIKCTKQYEKYFFLNFLKKNSNIRQKKNNLLKEASLMFGFNMVPKLYLTLNACKSTRSFQRHRMGSVNDGISTLLMDFKVMKIFCYFRDSKSVSMYHMHVCV